LATYYTLLRYFKLEEVVTVERKLARKLQRLRS
jgi:hypothetical protein